MPIFTGKQTPYVPGFGNELYFSAQQDFGFVGDFVSAGEFPPSGTVTVMTSGSPTLTMTNSAPFVKGRDEGKRILVQGAGASGAVLVTTILSVTSTTVATLAANASTTVTANNVGPVIIGVSFGTDNTAAINAMTTAVNTTYASFPGMRIVFGQSLTNAYGFPIPVLFNKTVQIEGIGGGYTSDVGDGTRVGGTRLAWFGTSSDGGTAFQAFFTCAPTGVQSLKRVAFRHAWIDCSALAQNQALIGLKLSSCQGFIVEDFYVSNALAYGLFLGIGTTPTEAKDTTRFTIRDYCSRQLDNSWLNLPMTTPILMSSAVVLTQTPQNLTVAANTLPTSGYFWTATTAGTPVLVNYTGGGGTTTLTGCTIALESVIATPTTVTNGNAVQATPSNACSIDLDGGSAANTCCGLMQMLQISYGSTWGSAALEFRNSDSIVVDQMMSNGGNATNDGVINRIRKPGVRFNGSIVSATLSSRNNVFRDGDPGLGGINVMGVNNAGARLTAQASPNYWWGYQLGNGAPLPVVEGNAYFQGTLNGGFNEGRLGSSLVSPQALVAATLTLVNGSLIAVPPQGFQVGTRLRWTATMTKTAAGAAIPGTFFIKVGTAGATADGTVATMALTSVGTAAIDTGKVIIDFTVTAIGGSAAGVAHLVMSHGTVATTGWMAIGSQDIEATMATWNSGTAQLFLNVSMTSGAAVVPTITESGWECLSAANY